MFSAGQEVMVTGIGIKGVSGQGYELFTGDQIGKIVWLNEASKIAEVKLDNGKKFVFHFTQLRRKY